MDLESNPPGLPRPSSLTQFDDVVQSRFVWNSLVRRIHIYKEDSLNIQYNNDKIEHSILN